MRSSKGMSMEVVKRRILVSFFFIFCFAVSSLCCKELETKFKIVLDKVTPDYFRFGDNKDKEIGTEGLIFSIFDSNLQSTASVSVVYDIRSSSILTLHRTAERTREDMESGYMMKGADNENSGLNYDLSYTAESSIDGESIVLAIPNNLDVSDRNKPLDLNEYDVVIYSPSNGNSSAGRVDFTFTMNPPAFDGIPSYMDDVYTGYLTLSLTAQ